MISYRYRELFVKRYFGDWMCKECERRPAVVCAPTVAAPIGCASCAALKARVAELEAELSAHRARESEAGRAATLADVPREVRTEIYQCAALEKENADLRERLAAAERELVRYRAMGVVAVGREQELGMPEFRDLLSGLAAAAQGGGSV